MRHVSTQYTALSALRVRKQEVLVSSRVVSCRLEDSLMYVYKEDPRGVKTIEKLTECRDNGS